MSEMMKNFSKMMNNQEIPDNIKNILNNFNSNTNNSNNTNEFEDNNNTQNQNYNNFNCDKSNTQNDNTRTNSNSTNNIFENIDINTIMKIQQIMNSMNDKQSDYRTNLLMSLKPYLKESRKNKVDQYVQLMKMGKIFEIMNPLGGDNKHA